MLNERKKVGISYCRTYLRTRKEIDQQQQTINDFANQQGIHIHAQYQVVGYSAMRGIRPRLETTIRKLEMKEIRISHLLIYSFDRVLRDPFQSLPEILAILEHVEMVVVAEEQTIYTVNEFRAFVLRLPSPPAVTSGTIEYKDAMM
ncbi:recombinase family protein [Sporosarcina cascadiensis]|uniref:recombinase family protein n=1 Tax=Sporosarcina cascadiensis TaxID=2660747 RepID=UPI001891BB71|nr:recombinase family protein [Sporosarcina cascadiensis]